MRKMFGTVINVSPSKVKAAVFTGVGYSLIEPLNSSKVEIGDLIEFKEDLSLGEFPVFNKTKGDWISVVILKIDLTSDQARQNLLMN